MTASTALAATDVATANVRAAQRMLLVIAAVPALVVLLLGLVLGAPLVGALLALAVAAALAAWLRRPQDDVVLRAVGARPADPQRHARLHNLVEGLCVVGGVPKPALFVIDTDARNAAVVGRSPSQASLVVTAGLLASLTRMELEGALAHEVMRIKRAEMVPATTALAAQKVAGPLARALLERAGAARADVADVAAVALTRYPPGLLAALERVAEGDTRVPGAPALSAHLWFVEAVPGGPVPSIADRIEALREL